MKEQYERLSQYEKKNTWSNRFGSLYRLYIGKLITKLFRDGKTWIFNILLLLPVVAGPIVALATDYISADDYYSLYSDIMFLGYFGIIIPLFTMYIASMMFSDEMGDRSITYLTVRPINRFELVIVKYISYLSIVPIFTVVVTFLNYISFGVFGAFADYLNMALWFLLGAFVSSAIYGAFFMLIGLLFKNPLWFGLFFVFIWEFVLASFSQTLNNLTISYYIKSLITHDYSGNGSPIVFFGNQAHQFSLYSNPANPLTFSIVLPIVVIISLTLAWAVLRGDKFRIPYKAGTRPGGWKYYLKEIRSYLITFSVLFITLGTVFGPVNGLTKPTTNSFQGDIEIDDSYWWYDPFDPQLPDLDRMGWGYVTPFTLAKGDEISLYFSTGYIYGTQLHSFRGVVCTEETYQEFYLATQERWADYAEQMQNDSMTVHFNSLISDYFDLVDDLVADATESISFSNATTIPITLEATERTDYYFMIVAEYFSISEFRYFGAGFANIVVQGEIFRRTGFAFGFVLLGTGVASLGLAIYSLATYNSAIEIQRYNEQIEKYEKVKEEIPTEEN